MTAHEAVAVRETLGVMEAADRYNDWLYERCRPHLGPRVLDVGAGIGSFSERLLADGHAVVAVEPDPDLASILRDRLGARPDLTVIEGEAKDAPGTFDAAVCLNVLEHIPDDEGTLDDLRERLLPDGRLLLLVPAHSLLYGGIDRALGHERRYSAGALRSLLRRRRFRVEALRPVNPVGAVGWLVSSRLLRLERIPERPLRVYDELVPLLRPLDALRLPFGLSLWAVARPAG